MKNHMVQIHDEGDSKSRFKCPQCPKIYVKNAEYQRHFNSAHLGIKGRKRRSSSWGPFFETYSFYIPTSWTDAFRTVTCSS
jgi:uncharacterized C2H2 Zn-finger protein